MLSLKQSAVIISAVGMCFLGSFPLQANSNSILELHTSNRGLEKMLEGSFNSVRAQLENFLKQRSLSSAEVGGKVEECSKQQLKRMSSIQRSELCPGIPDFFFKDNAIIPDFTPRPTRVQIRDFTILNARFAPVSAKCEGEECLVSIPLEEFKIKTHIHIIHLNDSSKIQAGESILEFKPLVLRIGANAQGELPVFNITTRIRSSEEAKDPISFVLEKSMIVLPLDAISIELEKHFAKMTLGEILNSTGKLSMHARSFKTILGAKSVVASDFKDFYKLIDLNLELNQHFSDPSKINYVVNIVNKQLLPTMFGMMNEGLRSAAIFKGLSIQLPENGLDEIFIHHKLHSGLQELEQFIQTQQSQIENDKRNRLTYHGYVEMLQKNAHVQTLPYIQKLKGHLSLHQSRPQAQTQEEKASVQQMMVKLVILEKNAQQSLRKQSDLVKLKLSIRKNFPTPHSLSIKLVEDSGAIQESTHSRENYEVMARIGFTTLNKAFQLLFEANKFSLCLTEDPFLTCSLVPEAQQKRISTTLAPEILWDAAKKTHFLKVRMRKEDNQEGDLRAYFQVNQKEGGDVVVTTKIEMDAVLHTWKYTAVVMNQTVDIIRNLHPIMKNLLPEKMIADGISLDVSGKEQERVIHLDTFRIHKILIEENGLVFWAGF